MDKITGDISAHFGRDKEKMIDFLTLTHDEFMFTYSYLTDIEYFNTVVYCLNVLNMLQLVDKPIGQIDGIYIEKLSLKKGLPSYYLFTICS